MIEKEIKSKLNLLITDLYIFYGESESLNVYIDEINDYWYDLHKQMSIENKYTNKCSKCNTELTPSYFEHLL